MYALKGFNEETIYVFLEIKSSFIPAFSQHALRKGGIPFL